MKGALKAIIYDFPKAKPDATVGAAVPEYTQFPVTISPGNEFFAETGKSSDLVSPYLAGLQDYIPLIWDHDENF